MASWIITVCLIWAAGITGCVGQAAPPQCNETFERYFGYRLASNASQDLVLKNFSVTGQPNGTLKTCRQACIDNPKCQGFALDMKESSCAIYGQFFDNEAKFLRTQLENATGVVFWKKTCLKATSNCTYLWHYDAWPGYSMRADKVDRFLPVSSMDQCQEACMNEKSFQCRSAMYNYVTRTCHLCRHDRRSVRAFFSRGSVQEVYLENHCATSMTTGCEFASEQSAAPAFMLNTTKTVDVRACEKLCLENPEFTCRSYTFTESTGECSFGPDDTFTFVQSPPQQQQHQFDEDLNRTNDSVGVTHFQRNECTNVEVICGPDQMVANFRADRPFDGRIVSMRAPNTCTFDVKQQFEFNVSFSLEKKGNCGISDDEPNTVTAMIMMQYHDSIITAKDRLLKLVCKYELNSRTVSNFVELGEGHVVTNATVVTGGGVLPEAIMRIVNGEGQTVTTAEIGQTLYAEVILRENGKPTDGPSEYSLFVNNCEALDEGQSVLLIDDAGCPTDTALFEAFHPIQGGNYKVLRAAFQGFRFQTKRRVNINCNVNFCFRFCQPALCTDKNGHRIMSLGRRRRRRDLSTASVRVQSAIDVLDSRNIPILSVDNKSGAKFETFSVSSSQWNHHHQDPRPQQIFPSTMTSILESTDANSKNIAWQVIAACVCVGLMIFATGFVLYYLRKRRSGRR